MAHTSTTPATVSSPAASQFQPYIPASQSPAEFTIRAVTGVDVAEGEMLVLSPHGDGTFEILGRMAPDDLPVP